MTLTQRQVPKTQRWIKTVLSDSVHDAFAWLCKIPLELLMFLLIIGLLLQAEGPTVRDLKVRYSTGKKTSKNKKKLERAMKVLKVLQSQPPQTRDSHFCICIQMQIQIQTLMFQLSWQKHKKKRKAEVFNFSAIHLIHDPQGILTFYNIHLTATATVQKK